MSSTLKSIDFISKVEAGRNAFIQFVSTKMEGTNIYVTNPWLAFDQNTFKGTYASVDEAMKHGEPHWYVGHITQDPCVKSVEKAQGIRPIEVVETKNEQKETTLPVDGNESDNDDDLQWEIPDEEPVLHSTVTFTNIKQKEILVELNDLRKRRDMIHARMEKGDDTMCFTLLSDEARKYRSEIYQLLAML